MRQCGANAHCCVFNGYVCQYLLEDAVEGFKYSCALKLKYGTWDAVGASIENRRNVQHLMDAGGYAGLKCYEWPPDGVRCNNCG